MPASRLANKTPAPPAPKSARPGRPKDLEKRAAILDAAKHLFPLHGFDGVSMETIAAEAGVSKLTVYNHFQDKEGLFSEAVKCRCEELLPHEVFEADASPAGIDQALRRIGHHFLALISSDESIQLHRILAARAMTDSRLAELFYEAGPRRTLQELEGFLRRAVKSGALQLPDPARAAAHFFCLLKGEQHMRLIMGCCARPSKRDCERHVDSVVTMFLRAYARD